MENLGLSIFQEHRDYVYYNDNIHIQLFNYAVLGNTEKCKILLEQGSDPNYMVNTSISNGYEQTALMASVAKRHYETTELLLKYHADPNIFATLSIGDQPTALIYAIWNNDYKMCKLLINHGAKNVEDERNRTTPIHVLNVITEISVGVNYYDIIQLVLEHEDFRKDFNKHNLLLTYLDKQDPRMIELYYKYLVIEEIEIDNFTIFYRFNQAIKIATEKGHKNVIQLLGNIVYNYWQDNLNLFCVEISKYVNERKSLIYLLKDSVSKNKKRSDVIRMVSDYI